MGRQASLFADQDQPDMFGPAATAPAWQPNPDKVRARLHRLLAEVKASDTLEPSTLSLYRTIFPQMSLFLPEAEGMQLRLAFEAELDRLTVK